MRQMDYPMSGMANPKHGKVGDYLIIRMMFEMQLPEYGYTPKNYKALVESTGLTNAQFCREFNIHEQTFYKHTNGSRTMKWQDWKSLLQEVEKYLN